MSGRNLLELGGEGGGGGGGGEGEVQKSFKALGR